MIKADEAYVFAKTFAYNCIKFFNNLSMKQKLEFIESCIPFSKNSDFFRIFISTLLLPNDIEFINTYNREKSINYLSKKYNVPSIVIVIKMAELEKYNLLGLLNFGIIDKNLACQNNNEINNDELLLAVFPNQPLIEVERIQDEYNKQQIFQYLKRK